MEIRYLYGYESTIVGKEIDLVPQEIPLYYATAWYEFRHMGLLCRFNPDCKHIRLLVANPDRTAYVNISYWELYAGGNTVPNPATPWVSGYDEVNNVYLMMWTPAVPYIAPPGMMVYIVVPSGLSGKARIDYIITVRRVE